MSGMTMLHMLGTITRRMSSTLRTNMRDIPDREQHRTQQRRMEHTMNTPHIQPHMTHTTNMLVTAVTGGILTTPVMKPCFASASGSASR